MSNFGTKKLSLFVGGHPASLDDLEHLQEGFIERIAAVVDSLKADDVNHVILYGCEYDGSVLSAGAVFLENDIYFVEEQAISGVAANLFFVLEEKVRNDRNVTYLDTAERSVHIINTAQLQLGSGVVSLSNIERIEVALYEKLNITNLHYTKTEIDSLFDAFRDGYDVILDQDPDTSEWRWAYKSPPHPDAPGAGANPWNPMGILGFYRAGVTGGLFEVEQNISQPMPPAGGIIALHEFDTTVIDEGDVPKWVLNRQYICPVAGDYDFLLEDIQMQLVSSAVGSTVFPTGGPATPSHVLRGMGIELQIAIYKNGVVIEQGSTVPATILNAGTRDSKSNRMPIWYNLSTSNNPQPYNITHAINTIYNLSPLHLRIPCMAGDVIDVRTRMRLISDTGSYVNPLSSWPALWVNIFNSAYVNAAIAYRIKKMNFLTTAQPS